MSDEPLLRKLSASDIPAALELSTEAGWNQTADDWRLLVDLSPEGCLAIEVAGMIVATATLVTYERRLGWIGIVLTRVAYRGRGFAKRLMNETLRLADTIGVESVKLDATDQGKSLYEKLGFRSEHTVELWKCAKLNVTGDDIASAGFTTTLRFIDQSAFGANRAKLLESLARPDSPIVSNDGYAMTRKGRASAYIGPSVAQSADTADRVIAAALARHSGQSCYWDLIPGNTKAVALAHEFGFEPKRHLTRMVRGKDLRGTDHHVYALAGFELG